MRSFSVKCSRTVTNFRRSLRILTHSRKIRVSLKNVHQNRYEIRQIPWNPTWWLQNIWRSYQDKQLSHFNWPTVCSFWFEAVQMCVNILDKLKSLFKVITKWIFCWKNRRWYSRERALQSLPKQASDTRTRHKSGPGLAGWEYHMKIKSLGGMKMK